MMATVMAMGMELETEMEGETPADAAPRTRPAWQLGRGATLGAPSTTFSVWAPRAKEVTLHLRTGAAAGDHPMTRVEGARGEHVVTLEGVAAGDRYGYRIEGGEPTPDPVSRSQPDGVHGLSEVVDPDAFVWHDPDWRGVSLADLVIYELHVGTFTPEGTFDAAAARLAELHALGVTAVELMPVAEFPGQRNWGYDGVNIYAPHHAYGGVEGLKRFVDTAHTTGLGVVLDVVYNHLGPEGNYLDRFGPYQTEVYRTPWGRAVNYDGRGSDEVRRWAHDNALYWISEFHVDALRLDAVHGIFDFGALAFLEELSDHVHELGRRLGRKVQLLAESDLNDPRLVRPPEQGGFGIDAQWADDVHHTIHAMLTGERHGYYEDFAGTATIADVMREPFFYARRYSPSRDRVHGRSSAGVPRQRFIVSVQNHDQVGNRALGERLSSLVPPERQRLAAALLLLSPYLPLLFMGEEYAETAPFQYFTDHGDPALVEAVREGRKREFAEIGRVAQAIDPQAVETFQRSKLDWSRRNVGSGAQMLRLYTDLLALRREEPALRPGAGVAHVQGSTDWCTVVRSTPHQPGTLWYAFNSSCHPVEIPVPDEAAGGWRLRLTTDALGYGGAGEPVTESVPAAAGLRDADAPKRLLSSSADAVGERPRAVHLPAWSAAVYLPDVAAGEDA